MSKVQKLKIILFIFFIILLSFLAVISPLLTIKAFNTLKFTSLEITKESYISVVWLELNLGLILLLSKN